MKLRAVNKIMTIDFTRKAEMTVSIFSNNIINRDLIKFLKIMVKITIGVGRY